MKTIDAETLGSLLPYDKLVDKLAEAFRDPPSVPPRHHYDLHSDKPGLATFLVMPSWHSEKFIGTKLVTVMPENTKLNLPTISGLYALFEIETGQPVLLLDAPELTARRTTATSALASRYLSRTDAKSLLVVGSGTLAEHMVPAHSSVRKLEDIMICGRTASKTEALATKLKQQGFPVRVVTDIEAAARSADIISCATTSYDPIIKGEWLKEGSHLDLVGAFRADMREVDTKAVQQADLYADTWAGVLAEGGDIVIPKEKGLLEDTAFKAELAELTSGAKTGRQDNISKTLFKSVGTAISDFAAAELAYEVLSSR
jgi:ornithine cyclodeaminase/alanine dehydrogenase-like protein (mu-crystallin family)